MESTQTGFLTFAECSLYCIHNRQRPQTFSKLNPLRPLKGPMTTEDLVSRDDNFDHFSSFFSAESLPAFNTQRKSCEFISCFHWGAGTLLATVRIILSQCSNNIKPGRTSFLLKIDINLILSSIGIGLF